MPFAVNKNVRLHWDEQGQGTPVLLIMGHRYTARMWYPILADLAAKHRVIRFDNRGVGESDTTSKASIGDFVADSIAVMDAAGVDKAHVFGVSMGGGIAIEFAIRHPERTKSLIAGCTLIKTPDKPRTPLWLRLLYRWAPWFINMLMRRRSAGADHGYGRNAPADKVAFDQKTLSEEKATVVGIVAQATAIANYSTTLETAAGITAPTLVLHGDEDALVPYAGGVEVARTLPNTRLITVEGAGHNFFVAGGQRVNDEVLKFIDEVDRGGFVNDTNRA